MPDNAPMDRNGLLCELQADYPQWHFAIRQGYGGPRLEAHRPHPTSGLYAVITADPAELRHELDSAAPDQDPTP
jgi:hypothetical protein